MKSKVRRALSISARIDKLTAGCEAKFEAGGVCSESDAHGSAGGVPFWEALVQSANCESSGDKLADGDTSGVAAAGSLTLLSAEQRMWLLLSLLARKDRRLHARNCESRGPRESSRLASPPPSSSDRAGAMMASSGIIHPLALAAAVGMQSRLV